MDLISLAIYAAMIFLVVTAVPALIKLRKCSGQLKKAANQITVANNGALWRDQILHGRMNCDEVFDDPELRYQMVLYQAEISNTEMGGGRFNNCDIGEFFNPDLLDHIGHRVKCEQTAGALTALGILGTFLGLASGLNGFNFTDTDNIIHGIENLLQGMSTAFWTSIVGITGSLIFSMIHQWLIRNAQTNLDSFLDIFRCNVLDDQTDTALRRIVEQLSVLENLDTAMASAVGEAVGRHMDGQMDRIIHTVAASCDRMAAYQSKALQDLSASQVKAMEDLSQSQNKALEKMVTDFTESLKASLGTHFDHLGQSIDQTSGEYTRFSEELSAMTSTVSTIRVSLEETQRLTEANLQGLSEVSSAFSSAVQSFDESLQGLERRSLAMNTDLEGKMGALDTVLERSRDAAKAQEESSKSILSCCDQILKVVSETEKQTAQLQKMSEGIAADSERILRESVQTLEKEMSSYSEELQMNAEEFRKGLQADGKEFHDSLQAGNREFLEDIQARNRTHQASMQTQMEKMTVLVEEEIGKLRSEKRRGLFGRR